MRDRKHWNRDRRAQPEALRIDAGGRGAGRAGRRRPAKTGSHVVHQRAQCRSGVGFADPTNQSRSATDQVANGFFFNFSPATYGNFTSMHNNGLVDGV